VPATPCPVDAMIKRDLMSLILVIAPLKSSINVHARVLSLLSRSSFVISIIPNTSWEQFSRRYLPGLRWYRLRRSVWWTMVEIICYIDPLSETTAFSFSLKTGRGTVLGSDLEVVWGPEPISSWDIMNTFPPINWLMLCMHACIFIWRLALANYVSNQLVGCRSFPYSVSRLPCPLVRAHVTGCSSLG
jgi:hypothetical protein